MCKFAFKTATDSKFFIPNGNESHLRLCTVQFQLHNESLTTKINGISQNSFSYAVCESLREIPNVIKQIVS